MVGRWSYIHQRHIIAINYVGREVYSYTSIYWWVHFGTSLSRFIMASCSVALFEFNQRVRPSSVAAAILPMGCRVDWTSKGQQNNKPMMNRRKLVLKWKSQYTSQLFTFPSNLVGNFILVFKFLTNDTTKFKVVWACQNVKSILLFIIDKVPLNSLLSGCVQRHLSIFKLRRVQM